MKKNYLLVLLCALLLNKFSVAQTVDLAFGLELSQVKIEKVMVGKSHRTIICGSYTGQPDFDPDLTVTQLAPATASGDYYLFVASYKESGMLEWLNVVQTNTSTNSMALGINSFFGGAVDSVGNIYLTGSVRGGISAIDLDPSPAYHGFSTFSSGTSMVLCSYDSLGGYRWGGGVLADIDQFSKIVGYDIVVDASQNVWITGVSRCLFVAPDFNIGSGLASIYPNSAKNRFFILRYSPNGQFQQLIHNDLFYTNSSIEARRICLDEHQNVYICGVVAGPYCDIDNTAAVVALQTYQNSNFTDEFFVASFTDTGSVRWAFSCPLVSGFGNQNIPTDLEYSKELHRIGFSGNIKGGAVRLNPLDTVVHCSAGQQYKSFVALYDTLGLFQDAFVFATSPNTTPVNIRAIDFDSIAQLHVVGSYAGSCDFDPSAGQAILSTQSSSFYLVLDSLGQFVQVFDIPKFDATALRIDVDNGKRLVGGKFTSSALLDIDPTTLIYPFQIPILGGASVIRYTGYGILTSESFSVDQQELIIYPNPAIAQEFITISLSEYFYNDAVSYYVYDVLGRVVNHGDIQSPDFNIKTSGLVAGEYILSIVSDKRIVNQRFFVVK